MEITRRRPNTEPGPPERFSGAVFLDVIAVTPAPAQLRVYSVHFTPGARTAWHRHPRGQVLHVLEGVGRAQCEGDPVQTIRAGDTVWFAPGERHWHGAGPRSFMTHLAIYEADESGSETSWEDLVSDEEYAAETQEPAG